MARKMATFAAAFLMSGGAAACMQASAQTGAQDDSSSSRARQAQSVPYGFAGGYQETDRDALGFPDRPNRQQTRNGRSWSQSDRYGQNDEWRDDAGRGQSQAGRRWSDGDWAERDVWDDRYSLYDRDRSTERSKSERDRWNRDQSGSRSMSDQSYQQSGQAGSSGRTRLTRALRQAGFTDVRVLDTAYLVRARTSDGDTIFMFINPPSMDRTSGGSGQQSSDQQNSSRRDARSSGSQSANSQGASGDQSQSSGASSSSSGDDDESATPRRTQRTPMWQRDRDASSAQNSD